MVIYLFFFGGGGTKWWSYSVKGLLSTGPTPSSSSSDRPKNLLNSHRLLCIMGELAGGGSVAVAVGVSDR